MMDKPRVDVLEKPVVINIGFPEFFETLVDQEVEAVQVDWQPPAGGDEELIDLLDELL
ncbi:hypothetical protein ACFLWA_06200 [Chloroflexota bacterium]